MPEVLVGHGLFGELGRAAPLVRHEHVRLRPAQQTQSAAMRPSNNEMHGLWVHMACSSHGGGHDFDLRHGPPLAELLVSNLLVHAPALHTCDRD